MHQQTIKIPHKMMSLMLRRFHSTIFALSSGHGKCGVAVVRVSGPSAPNALKQMTKLDVIVPRRANLVPIHDPENKNVLDHGLVMWFPEPKSFTGEHCVEFQVHGGVAVVNSVLKGLGQLKDFRPAEPGEFTKRAFREGKIELTQAEGLADLINAETEMQQRQALSQVGGEFRKTYQRWRTDLMKLLANMEAVIDFSESEDIEDGIPELVEKGIKVLLTEIEEQLADARAGERLRNGVTVAILGETNVGKSTILNTLVQRPAAIVSSVPGTTRDLIELSLDLGGFPMIVVDTAGLRDDSLDSIEEEGMKRAKVRAESADLIALVLDASKIPLKSFENELKLQDFIDAKYRSLKIESGARRLVILNKCDLLSDLTREKVSEYNCCYLLSCVTEWGLKNTLDTLTHEVKTLCTTRASAETPTLTRTRHVTHTSRARDYLKMFLEEKDDSDLAISCEYLRKAIREIGMLSGKVSSEQILDVIFADFCIGK